MAEKRDSLLDFFDVRKPFPRITLRAPHLDAAAQTRREAAEASFARDPPPMCEEDVDPWQQEANSAARKRDEDDSDEYWKKYRDKEQAELLQKAMEERTGDEITSGQVVEGSFMSGLEANTLLTTSTHRTAADPAAEVDLLQKYNFTSFNPAQKLSIHEDKEKILDVIANNQVTIICGHTGCGKTTQIPQFILEHCATRRTDVNIVVTQPRRIAAQSVAARVCEERGWQLGRLVGYKVGMDKQNCSSDTRLMYCTTGVLKKMIVGKRSLNEWTHVILDEVHEREEDMDFLLLLCKKLINSNSRNVKLILMSATISIEDFQQYYSWPIPGTGNVTPAGSYQVSEKKTHEIKEFFASELGVKKFYLPLLPPDLYSGPKLFDESVHMCKNIIVQLDELEAKGGSQRRGTVLCFLPGEAEILNVKEKLWIDAHGKNWYILPLHSRIPMEDIQKVFRPPAEGQRKIILSTNMAESSVTIPDVDYVIDFCLTKFLVADPETNYVSLKLHWADKQSMTQRKGRCGRVRSGRSFALITEEFYNANIPERHEPEMKRAPLDKVILDTKLLDFGSPKELLALAMDPPELKNIHTTVMHLKQAGALLTTVNGVDCKDDGDLTMLGELIAGLPVDIRLGKLIVFGHLFDVLEETIIIAAGMSNKSIFTTPMEKKLQAYANKLVWADRTFSDSMAILIAYTTYQKHKREGHFERAVPGNKNSRYLEHDWCRQRYLQLKSLKDVEVSKEEIERGLRMKGIIKFPTPNRQSLSWPEKCRYIQYCLFGAFYPNYFVRCHGGIDLKYVHRELNNRDPMSTVSLNHFPNNQVKFSSIYSDSIKELFRDIADPDMMDVEFFNSKAVVQFARRKNENRPLDLSNMDETNTNMMSLNDHANLTGEILHQVYVAMKLKQLPRTKMTISVYKPEIAEKVFNEMESQMKLTVLERSDVIDFHSLGRVAPPALDVPECTFEVVHFIDPNCFWVHYNDVKHEMMMHKVEGAIKNAVESGKCKRPSRKQDLVLNGIYLAPFNDGITTEYYRARLDRIHHSGPPAGNEQVRVTFIDYGNTRDGVKCGDLLMITPDLRHTCAPLFLTKALALECTLHAVKPNPIRDGGRGIWDDEACTAARKLFEDRIFTGKIYSVLPQKDSPLLSITAYVDGVNVNKTLKSQPTIPYASASNESYLSDVNHDGRVRHQTMIAGFALLPENYLKIESLPRAQLEDEKCYSFGGTKTKRFESTEKKLLHIPLSGPDNPLLFNISAVHRIGSLKKIRIEPDSVNSVLLDQYPTDSHDQWMVAGHVGMTPSGDRFMLRSTTFLPFLPGLGALLTMIFSPYVELRCDRRRKRYTGFLSGLGVRDRDWGRAVRTGAAQSQSQKVSYHGEHDMEVTFDVNVDNEDITLINKIRYYINYALTAETFAKVSKLPLHMQRRERFTRLSNAAGLVEVQGYLHKYVNALFNKKRQSKNKEPFLREYHWLQLPKEEHVMLTDMADTDNFVYKMITGIVLEPLAPEAQKKLDKLKKLEDMAKRPFGRLDKECPICPGEIRLASTDDIVQHMNSKRHQNMLENL